MRLGREAHTIDQRTLRGQPLPDWYLEEPALFDGEATLLAAFDALRTCRPEGMNGPGRIPWTAIAQYAGIRGYGPRMTEVLEFVIMRLDEHEVSEIRRRAKAEPS